MFRFLALMIALLSMLSARPAQAQTCPAGNPRIAPDSRYQNNANGTVTDSKTALIWKQCTEGQSGSACTGAHTTQNWQQALSTAENSTFAGFSDWRLPNSKELQSLVETGCHSPSINTTLFPNTPSVYFWTSTTTVAPNASFAWCVGFNDGYVGKLSKSISHGVRLVRAGQ